MDKKLLENLYSLMDRIDKDKASMIIIDGGVGEGKTTLAVECADEISLKYNNEIADLKIQLAHGGEDLIKKTKQCYENGKRVIIYDEAGDFSKRGALSRFNGRLNSYFEKYRALRLLVILTLPNFDTLDNSLFDKRIPRMLLHCFKRNETRGIFKAYSLKRMLYIKVRMKDEIIKFKAYKSPNFWGRFYNLPDDRAEALRKITISQKLDSIISDKFREDLIGTNELLGHLGITKMGLYKNLKRIGVKPKANIKRQNYYDRSIINILKGMKLKRVGNNA